MKSCIPCVMNTNAVESMFSNYFERSNQFSDCIVADIYWKEMTTGSYKREDYLITICSDCLDNGFSTIETNEKQVESMMLSMLSNNKSIKV